MQSQKVRVIEGGKLVIPAPFRQALGIGPGDVVIVEMEGEELRIRSLPSVIRTVQDRLRALSPGGRLLSDEAAPDRPAGEAEHG